MKAHPFDYHAPDDLAEAIQILEQEGPEAKVLAGGQSLVPMMNLRLAQPGALVDIGRIDGLRYIREEGEELAVGALARHQEVLESAAARAGWPLLAQVLRHVGHPAIRNRGTVCGSIAHADPAAEAPTALATLDGRVVVEGPLGRREIPWDELFLTYFATTLDPAEIVVEARFPRLPAGTGTSFQELARRTGDFAMVGVAATLTVRDGVIGEARIGLTGVSPTPVRAHAAEGLLQGRTLGDPAAAFREVAEAVAEAIDPEDDIHASAAYRRRMAAVLTRRGLDEALDRAMRGA